VPLDDSDFVVIEAGPLVGVDPTITYYHNRASALTYVEPRQLMFAQIDVCKVATRFTTALVPTLTIEGDPV
jgi:hypothetical protein